MLTACAVLQVPQLFREAFPEGSPASSQLMFASKGAMLCLGMRLKDLEQLLDASRWHFSCKEGSK